MNIVDGKILNVLESKNKDKFTVKSSQRLPMDLPIEPIDMRYSYHPIGNQGYTGSCIGWGVSNGALQIEAWKSKVLPFTSFFSPKATWLASRATDSFTRNNFAFLALEGTTVEAALKFAKNYGQCLDEWMPNWGDLPMGFDDFKSIAGKYKIKSYNYIGNSFDDVKRYLSAGKPVINVLKTDAKFMRLYGESKLNTFEIPSSGLHGLHCTCFVGITKEDELIVRNSWGADWGENGYAYMNQAYFNQAIVENWITGF